MHRLAHFFSIVFISGILIMFDSCCSTRVIASRDIDMAKAFTAENTVYVIIDDIDLEGKTIRIGRGSILDFRGGSFSNGTVVGNETRIKADNYEVFKRGYTRYRAYKEVGASEKMPPILIKEYHKAIIIEGTWINKQCGSNWTGLENNSDEDVMLSIKNFVALHKDGVSIKFPYFNALGYETTFIPGNHVIDFSHSSISYPDNLDLWVDKSIVIPIGAIVCSMESGYGLISMRSNSIIKNLTLDGKSSKRQKEPLKLGVSCLLSIGNSKNVILENVTLQNTLGPAMVSHSKSENVTFKKCRFINIGEHIMYAQQYLGYCHFDNCIFDTWDSDRLSVFRNGLNYLYKHTPLSGANDVSYDLLYGFDLSFNKCTFINPRRVNSQGRTLGGFLTGDFPVQVKINDCKFIGAPTLFNPGGQDRISEKTGLPFRMIVCGCNGAPYAYASRSNYNLITEFFDCKNIPFRVVYAKRYENCDLFLDLYENSFENVSASFEKEFAEPLVIRNCNFFDNGTDVKINHPVCHRPIVFENCRFISSAKRLEVSDVISVRKDGLSYVVFRECEFDLPNFRIVGGNSSIKQLTVQNCKYISINSNYITVTAKRADIDDELIIKRNVIN